VSAQNFEFQERMRTGKKLKTKKLNVSSFPLNLQRIRSFLYQNIRQDKSRPNKIQEFS